MFSICRGVRQGCPVSALKFVIPGFPLATTEGQEVKTKFIQYADDGTLYLRNVDELTCALDIIKTFGKTTGLELNLKQM